jgi:hypothetical protein
MAESFIRKHYALAASRWSGGEGKEIIHDGVVAAATGIGIGYAAAHSKTDLEATVGHKRVPLDIAGSLAGLGFSLVVSASKSTRDLVRQASVAGLAISSYRATERFIHLKSHPALGMGRPHPAMAPAAHAGEIDISSDPVLQAAANL